MTLREYCPLRPDFSYVMPRSAAQLTTTLAIPRSLLVQSSSLSLDVRSRWIRGRNISCESDVGFPTQTRTRLTLSFPLLHLPTAPEMVHPPSERRSERPRRAHHSSLYSGQPATALQCSLLPRRALRGLKSRQRPGFSPQQVTRYVCSRVQAMHSPWLPPSLGDNRVWADTASP
jgi:hypothetical protein